MSDISVGDRVILESVGVGNVVQIDYPGDTRCFHIVFEDGDRKRIFDTDTGPDVEKVTNPLNKLTNREFDDFSSFELLTRANELSLAFEYDQLLSLSNSRINLEPYQVQCVHKVINAPEQRFLIADDVGLGKTIETGMILKELEARERAERVLIVSPAPLAKQWKRELSEKFDQNFWVYDSNRVEDIKNNIGRHSKVWNHNDRVITSIDYIKQDHVKPMLRDVEWDLIIFDEAHKLSKTEDKETQRYKVGKMLADNCENLLLLTATPHNGDRYRFWKLLQLIDKYMFKDPDMISTERLRDVMVRRGKENILDAEGNPVFKNRNIDTLPVSFTEEEQELYDAVTAYVENEYNVAKNDGRNAIGFAMVILQKRMVSSIDAIHKSLRRRRDALSAEHEELTSEDEEKYEEYLEDPDTLESSEREELEDKIIEGAVVNKDPELLQQEIDRLDDLVDQAEALRENRIDSKGEKLKEMVEKILDENSDERILIFTEYRDTLEYLKEDVLSEFKEEGLITEIHGDVNMHLRQEREELFRQGEKQIMLATDAAGEGINLQFAHIMFNYDLPWNPNRIDQRIGRLHRYGQDQVVQIYNLLVEDTREGEIFERLNEKVETIEEDLGQMSDVLGSMLENVDLEDLIMKAVTEDESVDDANQKIDEAVEERKEMLDKTEDLLMNIKDFDLEKSLEIIERSQDITFSNEDIEEFVRMFFQEYGGSIENTVYKNQYRLTPPEIVTSDKVPREIERATFDKEVAKENNPNEVEFIAFGHPLLENIIDFCSDRDTGIGGSTTVKKTHSTIYSGMGAQFNWQISIVSETGDIIEEELIKTVVSPDGDIIDVDNLEFSSAETREPEFDEEKIKEYKEKSFEKAKNSVEDRVEEVREEREKEYEIKTEEIEEYFEGKIEDAEERLEEFRNQPEDSEMKEANVARSKKELERLRNEKEEQLEREKQKKNVYSEAPELLNCALIKFE
jgi:SNF2 family DNA or RNA helicase